MLRRILAAVRTMVCWLSPLRFGCTLFLKRYTLHPTRYTLLPLRLRCALFPKRYTLRPTRYFPCVFAVPCHLSPVPFFWSPVPCILPPVPFSSPSRRTRPSPAL